ncbi:zinc finger BED domain-containing protein RICESLEEPER [Trifolium repens]|nr:zinc finger BED domain-containing protein RICESLEEPER [Trifolium repens]
MDSQTLEGAPAAVLVDLERDNVEGDDETQTPESGKNQGTTSLNRHWPKCDKIKYADIGQVMIDMQGKLKNPVIDKKVSRELCATAIIAHDLPYNFVEFQYIRNWLNFHSTTASSSTSSTHKVTSNLFNALKEHNQQLATSIGKSQLDIYLEEPSLDSTYQNYDDLNVLQWWKENRYRFKDLSLMAPVMGDDGERDGGRFQPTTTTSTEAYGVYDLDVDED